MIAMGKMKKDAIAIPGLDFQMRPAIQSRQMRTKKLVMKNI